MQENQYKTIELDNGHQLIIHDLSRKIGADAWVVIMAARMEIRITPSLFQAEEKTDIDHILETLGDHIIYEYRVERNMIMDHGKQDVFDKLVDTFLDNTGQYVAKPQFPEKLVLKEYRERIDKEKK